jgi:very-short-patch-repair endonuclease
MLCPCAFPLSASVRCGIAKTEAEKAVWYLLRDRRLGAKFRRQCRIANWVWFKLISKFSKVVELLPEERAAFFRISNW